MITIYLLITITTAFIAIAFFELCNDQLMRIGISLLYGLIFSAGVFGYNYWRDSIIANARIEAFKEAAEIIRQEEADKYQEQCKGRLPLRINGVSYKCERYR